MKKNHPSSFPSTPRNTKFSPNTREDEKKQNPETLYTTVAPQGERLSPVLKEDKQEQPLSREEQGLGATAATLRTTITLSEKQITALLQHSRLVTSYQENVRHMCGIVYGNPHALEEKFEEIQKNPATGDDLSLRIKIIPEGFHNLAGKQILGIKSSARKTAEEALPTLCGLVDCYVEAVKQVRGDLTTIPEIALPYYEQGIGKETIAKILQTSPYPESENTSLTNDKIVDRTRQHPAVKRYHTQIEYWCGVVFGKPDILQQQTEALFADPTAAEELAWQLAAYPQSIGHYAGVKVCGLKNKTRKHAEAGLSHLISAIDNCANAIQQVKESLSQAQQTPPEASARFPQDLSVMSLHHETAKSPQHTPEKMQDSQSRKTARSKTLAFIS
ncbi:BID domain-containing T4SS effector [Bartonella florencae]|uniref:BID domain-containing T4SS effector n=1 Tax=Bartonella florencae TaxID=928210 RepID=UPI0002DA1C99|nr:BID domain-containing T4SS effector [Bartonella florencae]